MTENTSKYDYFYEFKFPSSIVIDNLKKLITQMHPLENSVFSSKIKKKINDYGFCEINGLKRLIELISDWLYLSYTEEILDYEHGETNFFNGFVVGNFEQIPRIDVGLSISIRYSPPNCGNIFFGIDVICVSEEKYLVAIPELREEYPNVNKKAHQIMREIQKGNYTYPNFIISGGV